VIRYSGSVIGFPSDNVSPKDKLSNKWQLQAAEGIWSRYWMGGTAWTFQDRDVMLLKRLYSNGQQPPDKYMDWFDGQKKLARKTKGDGSVMIEYARKGYANVDYSIDSPAPVFKNVIQSVLSNSDYKIIANSLNPQLLERKKRSKWSLYVDSKMNKLREEVGLPTRPLQWAPRSKAEVEIFEKLGGVKLTFELALEDICQHVFDISDWGKMRLRAIEDEIDLNFVCGKVYTCHKSGATKIKHVAPQNLIMSWTDENSDKPTFIGHLEKVRIADVKADLLADGYTLQEIEKLAMTYHSQLNDTRPWQYFRDYDPNTERWRWEDITVDVFEYEYVSLDTEYYTAREAKDGFFQFFKDEEREEKQPYKDGRMRKTEKVPNCVIYEGKYIANSNIVYGYKKQPNIMKEDKHSCHSSYFFEKIAGKSITDRLTPIYDSIMLGRIKLQAAKWAAAPKGFAIDVSALSNISIGDSILKPLELIHIRKQNGVQLYKSVMMQGKVITQANAIQELEGGIGQQLGEWLTALQDDMNRAMQYSGISELLIAGAALNAEKGLGVSQIEVDATNHALYPLKEGLRRWKEKAAKCTVMKTLLNIKYDDDCRAYWAGVIGEEKVRAIMDVGQTTLENLSITLESLPNEGMKQMAVQMVMQSLNAGKSGQRGITTSDSIFILDLIEKGQIKLASLYLSIAEEREFEKQMEQQRAMQQENAQVQIQSAQAAEQAKVQAEQAKAQIEIQKHAAITNIDLQKEEQLQRLKGEQKLEQITLEATLEATLGVEITGTV